MSVNGPGFKWTADLLYVHGNPIYVPHDMTLKLRIIRNFHDSPTAVHMGRDRTASLIRRWSYWPSMDKEIDEYVKTCDARERPKAPRHQACGELTPIPIPSGPWKSITTFITDLSDDKSPVEDTIMALWSAF